jgi:hypothetical protein
VRATPYRLEEEKMAVILQQVVGTLHGQRFYPDFSGVVRSHNFYPVPPMTFADGIAAVALGLGRTVVDGGKCLMFCPRYPKNLLQFSSVEDILANTQTEFCALELDAVPPQQGRATCAKRASASMSPRRMERCTRSPPRIPPTITPSTTG